MTMTADIETQAIVVDEVFPHSVDTLWRTLSDGALMARWMMPPKGFAPVVGTQFSFTTKPAGDWDGTIACEVLEVVPRERLSYSWRGGDAGNAGYGSALDTIVTWLLSADPAGTRLRLVHSGFVLPRNEVAYRNMNEGWHMVLARLSAAVEGEK